MTYGYPPPPRDWRAPGPDDEEPVRPRQPPAEPPTGAWSGPATGGRRIPQPPPPARHVPPPPGQQAAMPAQPPYSAPPRSPQPYSAPPRSPQPYSAPPRSPQPYTAQPQGYPPPAAHQAPPRPTSPPPSMRRPPPNNQPGQPKGYPNFPPPVPTSPRLPPQAGAVRTGAFQPPTGPIKPPGASRNFAPPAAPNRAPTGKPGTRSPARPALPPLNRPRSVSFKDVPGLIKQLPQHKPWMITIGAIAVAVVVAICGMGSYMLLKDDSEVVTAPSPESTVAKRDISSRETDPNPLTAADVFPATEIVVDPTIPPYKRQGDPQISEDCRVGANGEVGKLLVAVGCSQVVRATFASTDGAYLVTAGIMNLPDATVAGKASIDIKGLVEAGQGRFTGYISDRDANLTIGRAPTNLNWEVRGHFIVYTVIAKVDGSPIEADDAGVKVIVYDLVQKYLRDHVIADWSIEKPSASPSA